MHFCFSFKANSRLGASAMRAAQAGTRTKFVREANEPQGTLDARARGTLDARRLLAKSRKLRKCKFPFLILGGRMVTEVTPPSQKVGELFFFFAKINAWPKCQTNGTFHTNFLREGCYPCDHAATQNEKRKLTFRNFLRCTLSRSHCMSCSTKQRSGAVADVVVACCSLGARWPAGSLARWLAGWLAGWIGPDRLCEEQGW